MAATKPDHPLFWVFGGPNGSGKSTAYTDTSFQSDGQTIWIVNPDLLTTRIQQVEGLSLNDANREAVVRIEAWLEASINTHKSVSVETVLSTGKYRRLVTRAKALGFEVRLTYVILNSPDLNVERVRLRVAKGGHDVPEAKIRERYGKSLQQLPWFFGEADRAYLFDNSTAEPIKILEKSGAKVDVFSDASPILLSTFGINQTCGVNWLSGGILCDIRQISFAAPWMTSMRCRRAMKPLSRDAADAVPQRRIELAVERLQVLPATSSVTMIVISPCSAGSGAPNVTISTNRCGGARSTNRTSTRSLRSEAALALGIERRQTIVAAHPRDTTDRCAGPIRCFRSG